MKVKTSELIGATLDWAVAKINGISSEEFIDLLVANEDNGYWTYRYSTNWAQGGPIIERELIDITVCFLEQDYCWGAVVGVNQIYGPTPLIAAMRCYVASKLGGEIEIPDELI